MKLINVLIITAVFYLLAVFQASFFVHFSLLGANFIFIAVVIWNIIEKQKSFYGLITAGAGGFFLDIFSSSLIGFNMLILLAVAILIKFIIKNYVRIPFFEKI